MAEQTMAGRVCMVTGANSGVGKATARGLARRGGRVVLVCRSRDRGEAARQEIVATTENQDVTLLLADLSSTAEIGALADEFRARFDRLDVLVNNAGAIFYTRRESPDGLEMTFALNHMGYFSLTTRLLDLLQAAAPARIVNVSSDAHRAGRLDFEDLQMEKGYSAFGAYANSKLANILFTLELSRRTAGTGVTANALHPGFVRSNFGDAGKGITALLFRWANRIFGISPGKGARTPLYLATAPDVADVSGAYFHKARPAQPAPQAQDEEIARRLWQESERLARVAASQG